MEAYKYDCRSKRKSVVLQSTTMDDNDYKFRQFLAKKPLFTGSDPPTNTDISVSSPSPLSSSSSLSSSLSPSSQSSASSLSSDLSGSSRSTTRDTHSRHSSSSSEEFDSLENTLLERWNTQVQSLALYLLTAWVLNTCPPVKKSGQLDLYLTDF